MAHYDSVFADEKQQLYVLAGLNLSSISACRAVSLFDTRHTINLQPDGRPLETSGPKNPSNRTKCESSFNKSEDEAPSGGSSHTTGKDTEMSELEETNLDDIFSHHSDLETASDVDCDSDTSSVTDDGYLEATKRPTLSFGDMLNSMLSAIQLPIMLIIYLHEYSKRFVIEHEENLIFDLLGQLMALAINDDIFVATMKDMADIYTVPIPAHRRVLRQGGINAINNQAPSSVRDQVADHESNAVKYYLNKVVDFDTAAAFHKRPSNKIVQRELRSATLLADHTAPIGLTDAQSRKISRDPEVRRLRRISRGLTARIRAMGLTIKDAAGTEAGKQKRRADAELNIQYFVPSITLHSKKFLHMIGVIFISPVQLPNPFTLQHFMQDNLVCSEVEWR
ncbi:hypothetical protein AOCH_004405 [Aspergillus ochraceoroseus]|uniref:Uncharacterized protein n=1 Tax=Aspergillus ochraceoroseus TaxID=138278 RepID=A0A0F8VJJ3_9EURO|nr:hypothetical protein AOCH_004405 [Aspergillus ochraceoroseus]